MTAVSDDILINTTIAGTQSEQDMTVLDDGRIVVVWTHNPGVSGHPGPDIFGQILNDDGTKSGGQFKVNTDRAPGLESATYVQAHATVSATADGGFVVVWRDNRPTTTTPFSIKSEIVAQRFNADGSKDGTDVTIVPNADQGGFSVSGRNMDVLGLANGRYVVLTETGTFPNNLAPGHDDQGVVIQTFDANGGDLDGFDNLNGEKAGSQAQPNLATDGSTFMAVWHSGHLPVPQNFAVMAQKFSVATGARIGPEIVVSPSVNGTQFGEPQVASLPGGRYVVTWTRPSTNEEFLASGTQQSIAAQIIAANGALAGPMIQVSAHDASAEDNPVIAARADGIFIVVWQEGGGTDNKPLKAQLYNQNGTLRGAVFEIGSAANPDAVEPEVVALDDGRFFVSWEDDSRSLAPADANEIHGAFVDPDAIDAIVINGGSEADTLNGTDAIEIVNGLGGDDTLNGAGGADVLNGGDGFDIASYEFSPALVSINLATGVALGGHAAGDSFTSIEGLRGSAFADSLTGDAGDNMFEGMAGGDAIDGVAGDFDAASYDHSNAAVEVSLKDATASGGHAAGDVLTAIESLIGSDFDDTLQGSDAGNRLTGGLGNDWLQGWGGFDVLVGDAGNDLLDGGANPDSQGDIMLGGAGDDTYIIDSPLDFVDEGFVFPTGFGGNDTIISYSYFYWDVYGIGETLSIDASVVDPFGLASTLVGGVYDNVLRGNQDNNVLFGRGGSDTYRAGDGIDFISLSLLGVDPGLFEGVNTVLVDKRASGFVSYDIVFEFEPGKDVFDLSSYGIASHAELFARGVDDGAGSSYFVLGDGLDYLYVVGLEKADLGAGDFIL